MTRNLKIEIEPEYDGARLDKLLSVKIPGLTRCRGKAYWRR